MFKYCGDEKVIGTWDRDNLCIFDFHNTFNIIPDWNDKATQNVKTFFVSIFLTKALLSAKKSTAQQEMWCVL